MSQSADQRECVVLGPAGDDDVSGLRLEPRGDDPDVVVTGGHLLQHEPPVPVGDCSAVRADELHLCACQRCAPGLQHQAAHGEQLVGDALRTSGAAESDSVATR